MGFNIRIRRVQGKGSASQIERAIRNEPPRSQVSKQLLPHSVFRLYVPITHVAKIFANLHKSLSMDFRFVHVSTSGVNEILP